MVARGSLRCGTLDLRCMIMIRDVCASHVFRVLAAFYVHSRGHAKFTNCNSDLGFTWVSQCVHL